MKNNIFTILKQMFGGHKEVRTVPTKFKTSSDTYIPDPNDIRIVAGDDVLIITDDKQIGGLWAGVDNYDPCSGSDQECFDAMRKLINENHNEACDSLIFKLEEHLYLVNLADSQNRGAFSRMDLYYLHLCEDKIGVFYPIIKHFVDKHSSNHEVGIVNLFGGGTSIGLVHLCDRLKADGFNCYIEGTILPFQKGKAGYVPARCRDYALFHNYEEFDGTPYWENCSLKVFFDNKVYSLLHAMTNRVKERIIESNDNMNISTFDLKRFIIAQNKYNTYNLALSEVRKGQKRSHWIWYIFPQVCGLGHSSTSQMYGIKSLEEAKAYFKNETLKNRLCEITHALLEQNDTASSIFGGLDAMKVRSCMTLFNLVSPNDIFAKVLDKFYDGKQCERTLSILKDELRDVSNEPQQEKEVVRPDYTPDNIESLRKDEVFVFGSNLAGHHAGGAARAAHMRFGAIMGQGVGLQGQSYAIPTMQGGVDTIKPYVDEFIEFAKKHKELFFYVTRIGCGIAGFRDEQIAPLFSAAICMNNVCLPESFTKHLKAVEKNDILEAPQSYRLMQVGQCRTLADIIKTLNSKNKYDSMESLMKDFGEVIEEYKSKRGYDGTSIELVEGTLQNHKEDLMSKGRFNIELFEELLNDSFKAGTLQGIDMIYTRRMCAKILILAKTLNDVCQYKNIEDLRYDLLCLATGRMNCGDSSYMSDPYPVIGNFPINWFLSGLSHLWNDVTTNGILDNELMEEKMFTIHAEKLSAKGIEAVLAEDYEAQGPCHPEVFYPTIPGSGPVYVKDETSRRYLKACGEGKGPRSGHELYEMNVVHNILRREVDKGEYSLVEGRLYIPTKDLHKPIFAEYYGRIHFASFADKKAFIERHSF